MALMKWKKSYTLGPKWTAPTLFAVTRLGQALSSQGITMIDVMTQQFCLPSAGGVAWWYLVNEVLNVIYRIWDWFA